MNRYLARAMALIFCSVLCRAGAQSIEKQLEIRTDFLIYTPKGYQEGPDRKWPLLINLHGADRNVDIENIHHAYLPYLIDSGKELPMVVVNPVCNKRRWNVDELDHMLDEILERYNVDPDRVYLSGFSMGGYGTWDWVFQDPGRFAAISPIAGCAYPSDLERAWRVRNVPIWIIHGERDTTVEIGCSHEAVEALDRYGADVRTTFHPDMGHELEEIWGGTLTDDDWYGWLLAQDRGYNKARGIPLDRKMQGRYVGTYRAIGEQGARIEIFRRKGRLHARLGKAEHPIHAESGTLFAVGEDPALALEFRMERGKVVGLDFLGMERIFLQRIE